MVAVLKSFSGGMGAVEKLERVKFRPLLHAAGLKSYCMCQWEHEGVCKQLDRIIHGFQEYCNPGKSVIWEKHVFFARIQLPGEDFDCYVAGLCIKAVMCIWTDRQSGTQSIYSITDSQVEVIEKHGLCIVKNSGYLWG